MRLSFDSIDEVKAFVASLKGGPRTKKEETDDNASALTAGPQGGGAPAPILPNSGGAFGGGAPAFSPPAQGGGTFPGAGAPMVAPEIMQLVGRIVASMDKAVAAGQTEAVLNWFRGEVAKSGHDTTNATLDQIKTVFLPKLAQPALENIAKLMNA